MLPYKLETLQTMKESARKFRERRHPQWTQNYELYRDTVITNRLTQRQSVNVPQMKETIKTQLARVDEMTQLYFRNKDNDKQKELYCNEWWKNLVSRLKLELLDIVDKKQVMLYGRSFRKLNIVRGLLMIEVLDPQDVLVDRYVNPWDLDSSEYVIHTGIYRRIEALEQNANYDKDAVKRLKVFYGTQQGLIKAETNAQIAADKDQRMADLGVPDTSNPILGQTIVELNEYHVKRWNESTKEFEIVVVCVAENEILMQKPLKEILGIDFYPFVSWADDLERTDFWSDGLGDIVRVPNQILNVWFSQLVENRTLRNFGMQFYNAKADPEWRPTPVTPEPFMYLPIPGEPDKVLKRIDIPELSESLDEMKFVLDFVRSATASTAIETGQGNQAGETLGEIEILAARANERITSMTKFSRQADKEVGDKAWKLLEANASKMVPEKLSKKNAKGDVYEKTLKPSEIVSKRGYEVEVTTVAEKQKADIESLQKMKIAAADFPTNVPLRRILKKKELDFIGLTAEEAKEVMDFEAQNPMPMMPAGAAPALPLAPAPALQPAHA